VDKLVKVWLKTGQELWVLIHLEVQGQRATDFATRVYVYHFRIFDRFNAPVATFVILTDEEQNWRPTEYRAELLGTKLQFEFSTTKLLDYGDRWDELEQSDNPFAVVVQAHLIALRTRNKPQDRLQSKWQLTRRLYERGFSKREIIALYRFLDWVLTLPKGLTDEFEDRLTAYEEERKMKYVTSIERRGIEKGVQIGLQKGSAALILRQLQRRFGALEETVQAQVRALPLAEIEALSDALFGFATRADLETWLQQHPLSTPPPAAAPAPDSIAN